MAFCFVDLETTSLNPVTGEILEIGAVMGEREFNIKVQPIRLHSADPKALEINGYNVEEWAGAPMLSGALEKLNEFVGTGRPYFMAYNAAFDWGFMQHAYSGTGVQDPFHYHHLDLLTLAWHKLPPGSSLSLKNVCQTLGIPPEPGIHRALNGARCAYEVFKKLV